MITFTFAHKIHDDLKDLERKFAKALKKMREHRQYVELLDEYGYFGLIKALECTYGQHGWHPHSHELFFFTKEIPAHKLNRFHSKLFECWYNACEKVGLGLPTFEHGIKVKRSYSPAEYLAKFGYHQKWGAGSELSKSNFKKSRRDTSRTVWDLLDDYEKGDQFAGAKFLEFNRVFFGKSQMYWSQGLKKLFLIEERTDEELAQLDEEHAQPELFISPEDWLKVVRQEKDVRSKILDIAEREGPDAVWAFISSLVADHCPDCSQELKRDERADEKLVPLVEEQTGLRRFISPKNWLKVVRREKNVRTKVVLDVAKRNGIGSVLKFVRLLI